MGLDARRTVWWERWRQRQPGMHPTLPLKVTVKKSLTISQLCHPSTTALAGGIFLLCQCQSPDMHGADYK
jgi:hypothetical protein